MNILKGKLTYLMALVAIVFGIYSLITKTLDSKQAWEIIWAGLTTFGVRRAIG